MKCAKLWLMIAMAVLVLFSLNGCADKDEQYAEEYGLEEPAVETFGEEISPPSPPIAPPQQLPVKYQTPAYVSQQVDAMEEPIEEQYILRVGANISSIKGPQPLWDILKRLANLKGMNVSWASDVDQQVLVDVNISANDPFFEAIDNLLRQVDYYHEVQKNTIIVKYKDTRHFYITLPYMKSNYTTNVGGNFLTDRTAATGTEGTVKISSDGNQFDVWSNIQENLEKLINAWQTTTVAGASATTGEGAAGTGESAGQATRRIASAQPYYMLDKSVGLITVNAPRPLLEKVENYINTLKKELYKQVIIEAKIIEVYLEDSSRIGLDWSQVLEDFDLTGMVNFGDAGTGQVYPWIEAEPGLDSPTRFVSSIQMASSTFTTLLNALEKQGESRVLSNPKITVLNGQPALISVGKDVAYIKEVSSEYNADTATYTYTAETDSIVEGIALGVVATVRNDNSAVLQLTPITTEIVGDAILYEDFGAGLRVGVPEVGIREMSTMVTVKNGEMLIIGGLIDSIESDDSEMAPLMNNVPVLKYLFGVEEKVKEKRELVILLTPTII